MISACMMVKNEESNITRCLNSIKDYVDEICIIDTGSTDRTLEIINEFKKEGVDIKLSHEEWTDDFSYHRNNTLEKASGDWLFVIDADEELFVNEQITPEKFKKSIEEQKNLNCITLSLVDWQREKEAMRFNSPRLFRKGKVNYLGIVHNSPQIEGNAGHYTDAYLKHYGYDLTPEQKKLKKKRTVSLLHKRLEKNSDDYECHFYLSQMHNEHKEYGLSAEYANRYIKLRDLIDEKSFHESVYFTQIRNYMYLNDTEKAHKTIKEALELYPKNIDISLALCEFGNHIGNFDYVEQGAKRFLELYVEYSQDPALISNRFTFSYKTECLVYCMRCLGMQYLFLARHHLNNLFNVLPAVSEDYKKIITEQINQDITAFNDPQQNSFGEITMTCGKEKHKKKRKQKRKGKKK